MNNRQQLLYVGMDVHKDTHTAVATNCFGQQLLGVKIANSKEDFQALVENVGRVSKTKVQPEEMSGWSIRF